MDKNEKIIFQHDIEVPPIVMEKAEAAFLTIEKEGRNIMRENKSVKMRGIVKSTAAVAACAALLVAAGVAAGDFVGGDAPVTEVADRSGVSAADGSVGGKGIPTAEGSAKDGFCTVEPTFSLAAYAPEGVKTGVSGDGLVFTDIGHGEGGFTGMLFQVQGDGITDVDMKIDKGALYTTTIEETTVDAIHAIMEGGMPDEDGDPKNVISLMQKIGDHLMKASDMDGQWVQDPETKEWTNNSEAYKVLNRLCGKLEKAINKMDVEYDELDTKAAFLDGNSTRLTFDVKALNEQILGIEEIDPVAAITSLSWAQYCYNAGLKIGTSILSQSLIDYMN